ncbi:unnamed protein product [Allacma fusca]|uniref:C2 domain-containing protein n=1 Tax=Allacma fusca TaxID=39272 RepID=A0A8J2JF57_9HEXA|nr:unnamed protein product [Allacma fusca]
MEYRFEQSQVLRFEVYDIDDEDEEILDAQDSIGYLECTVANIVSAGPKGFIKELDSEEEGAKTGTIILIAEELASLKDEINLKLSGHSLGSLMNCFMPKTFYSISKINDAGTYLVVFRSQETRGSNPIYPNVTISGRTLCNGDKDRQLKLEVWKRTLKGEDELVGFAFTTLSRMSSGVDDRMQLMGRSGQPISSSLYVLSCNITPVFTFFDFVQAGTRIHLIFSIDFTNLYAQSLWVMLTQYISHAWVCIDSEWTDSE